MAQGNRITKDIGLIGELETRKIRMDVANNEPINEPGQMAWDEAYETIHLFLTNGGDDRVEAHLGQEVFYYVKANATITRGQVVFVSGTEGASGHILAEPFLADGTYDSKDVLGLAAQNATSGDFIHVLHFGKLTSVDTRGYSAGAFLYASASTAGALTATAPDAPNNIVTVALALNSKSSGTLVVRPRWGAKLTQTEDVYLSNLQDGDTLTWQSGTNRWENTVGGVGLSGSEVVSYDGSIS